MFNFPFLPKIFSGSKLIVLFIDLSLILKSLLKELSQSLKTFYFVFQFLETNQANGKRFYYEFLCRIGTISDVGDIYVHNLII